MSQLHAYLVDPNTQFELGQDDPPNACEVTQVSLQDPLLADSYQLLPPLRACDIVSKREMAPRIWFTDLPILCPSVDTMRVRHAITFQRSTTAINLSRAAPSELSVSRLPYHPPSFGSKSRSVLKYLNVSALAVSTGVVRRCHLIQPYKFGRKYVKNIHLALFFQESERLMSCVAMAFCQPSITPHGFQSQSGLIVTTETMEIENRKCHWMSFPVPHDIPIAQPRDDGKYSRFISVNHRCNTHGISRHSLLVPIYDARHHPLFGLDQDLTQIDDLLPRYRRDLPPGSVVTVGYNPLGREVFRGEGLQFELTPYIRWVILWGIA